MSTVDLSTVMPAIKQGMGDIDFSILQHFIEEVPVARGEVVAQGGDVMDYAFVVTKGCFSTHLAGLDGAMDELLTAGPGRWIGQMYFLEPGENPVTLTALDDSAIGRISAASFDKMSQSYPATSDKLLHTLSIELSNRMRKAGRLLFKRFAWDQVEGVEGEDAAKQWFTKVYCEMNGLFS